MKALCWHGKEDVRVEKVPDPKILNPHDAVVRITTTAICGSDLHLYDGFVPTMEEGDILGHEFMGEVVEVGSEVRNLRKGDRVVVPFTISCGSCFFCQKKLWSLCDNTNPSAHELELVTGYASAGLYGYSHMYGGYAGGYQGYGYGGPCCVQTYGYGQGYAYGGYDQGQPWFAGPGAPYGPRPAYTVPQTAIQGGWLTWTGKSYY